MNTGQINAIKLAEYTLTKVPAYRQFLHAHKISINHIKTFNDFQNLPITNKANYIHKYRLLDLSPIGRIPNQIHSSSGSSGLPTYWFRDFTQDESGGLIHQKIFSDIFKIPKNSPTLVIICFSMGVWVAGGYTLSSFRWLSAQGYNLSCITPGIEKHDIFNIFKNLAPTFQNVVLAGYPAFIMDILQEAKKQNLIPKNLKLLTSGDAFSMGWNKTVLGLINQKQPESIISVYGSADAGAIAFETPLGIFLKQEALKNKILFSELFGNAVKEPSIFQYLPKQIFAESINGELILTAYNTIPLIRYNIHDQGQTFSYSNIIRLLKKHNLLTKAKKYGLNNWKLPFITQYGRTDVAITFYALNIYPEHIKAGLKDRKVAGMVSGNFRAFSRAEKKFGQENLHLEVEIAENIKPNKKILNAIANSVSNSLLRLNGEFKKLHTVIGQRVLPEVSLIKKLQPLPIGHTSLISLKGKKPKILI